MLIPARDHTLAGLKIRKVLRDCCGRGSCWRVGLGSYPLEAASIGRMDLLGSSGESVGGDAGSSRTSLIDLRLWGKFGGLDRPYPLVWHLLDAGSAAEVLWREVVARSVRRMVARALGVEVAEVGRLIAFWASLHDIGKIIPDFQLQVAELRAALAGYSGAGARGTTRHDEATHRFLHRALIDLGYDPVASAAEVAQILGGHHGCFHGIDDRHADPRLRQPDLGGVEWERQRAAVLAGMREVFQPPAVPAQVGVKAGAVITGLVILADWLVSQEDFLRTQLDDLPADSTVTNLRAHRTRAVGRVADLLREAGLGRLALTPGTFEEEFPPYDANALQRSVAENLPGLLGGPGVLLVTAPMGMGKTETALHAARLMGEAAGTAGLLVTLPTMATADQMYRRVREYAERRTAAGVDTAVALLHSMAWLNTMYAPDVDQGAVLTGGGEDLTSRTAATAWLRGRKRGLLAPLGIGTIDQALLTVLPVRHNVLRMLGLAGKVLVVDEVHAYDAYMQYLLARLLTWLGALGAPVVLLSATLPASVGERLVRAYLFGARGRPFRGPVPVEYPGWVYADGASAVVTSHPVEAEPRDLAVDLHTIAGAPDRPRAEAGTGESDVAEDLAGEDPFLVPVAGGADRSEALQRLLAPILHGRGCAMVVCTTVAEAQHTFAVIRWWCARALASGEATAAPRLMLLHARMPTRQRNARTEEVTTAFGRDVDRRPRAAILVATQVAEQSLDLDLDLVVSDLAPVAQLLQRAGRCQRHPQVDNRPAWAAHGPRLAVLVPRDGDGALALPRRWRTVYDRSLLRRTCELLERRGAKPVRIPGDVQAMVEEVYAAFDVDVRDDDIERLVSEEAQRGIASIAAIKAPSGLRDLLPLTRKEIDEDRVSTRLGAESVRTVCCYLDEDGARWLDTKRTVPLPDRPAGSTSRFARAEIAAVLAESIPLRDGPWRWDARAATAPPASWTDNPTLRDLAVLSLPVDADGTVHPATAGGGREFRLDPILGLVG